MSKLLGFEGVQREGNNLFSELKFRKKVPIQKSLNPVRDSVNKESEIISLKRQKKELRDESNEKKIFEGVFFRTF